LITWSIQCGEAVIKSFRSNALRRFWLKGEIRRIDARHVDKVRRQLAVLDHATSPEDMNLPGWRFHKLHGARWAVWVDQNWRLTFAWSEEGPDAVDVDYEDYH
jgi:proteic killer suppression protein